MDWSSESLYNKAKLFALRAHDSSIDSELFGIWMSFSLELVARAAIAHVHPVLLADPREPDNLQYAFGMNPEKKPHSIPAKALFTRCSTFVGGFTDTMATDCLKLMDKRNSELHSGAAAFVGIANASWLPRTYEVLEILLKHLKRDFEDFLGSEYAQLALESLANRRDTIKREVHEALAAAKKYFENVSPTQRPAVTQGMLITWMREHRLNRETKCPACGSQAAIGGEIVGRNPVRVEEDRISREIRILPTLLMCPHCDLVLKGFQQLNEAGAGSVYTLYEEQDPIEYFGIIPEELVDVDALIRAREDDYGYSNE